jgi:hypothetical protein
MRVAPLSLVFVSLIFSVGCGEQPASSGSVTQNSKKYLDMIPEDSNVLVYANFQALRNSKFGSHVQNKFSEEITEDGDEEYLEFVEKTGLNVEKDVHEIWISAYIDNDEDNQKGGAIVRADYDRDRILAFMREKEDVSEIKIGSHTAYRIEEDHHGNSQPCLAFLNKETVAIGEVNWLEKVLIRGNGSILKNEEMTLLMSQIPADDHAWGIFNIEKLADRWAHQIREHGSGFKGTKSIEKMQSVLISTRLSDQADILIEGAFATAEEATLLSEMLNGFKSLGKLMVSDDKEAIDMLNDIKIDVKGSKVQITTRMQEDFFEKVEQKRKKFANGGINIL